MAYFKNISFSFIELYIELLLDNYLKANIFFSNMYKQDNEKKKTIGSGKTSVHSRGKNISNLYIFPALKKTTKKV